MSENLILTHFLFRAKIDRQCPVSRKFTTHRQLLHSLSTRLVHTRNFTSKILSCSNPPLQADHAASIKNKDEYWGNLAMDYLDWFQPFDRVSSGKFEDGSVAFFLNGKINACYNAVDRHLPERKDQVAILWEGDEVNLQVSIFWDVFVCLRIGLKIGRRSGDNRQDGFQP